MVTEIQQFESPDLIALEFCLWGWMKSEVYEIKVDTPDELLIRILNAAAYMKINSNEQHAIFAHKLPSVLRFMVGF